MASQVPTDFLDLYSATQEEKRIVNVIGVVTDLLPPKRTRGTDLMFTFTIDDGTVHGDYNKGQKIRYFGKERMFPPIQGPGDALILRNLRCMTYAGQMLLISTMETSWTIFLATIPCKMPDFGAPLKHTRSQLAANPTKPEMEYVISLANNQNRGKFSAPLSQEVKEKLKATSEKFALIKDVVRDTFHDLVGQVVKIFPSQDRLQLYITDYTENQLLFKYSSQEEGPDQYGGMSQTGKKWQGPLGKYTLLVYAFPPHSYWTCHNVNPGDFVHVRNVRVRSNRSDDRLVEGVLHGEKVNPDRVNVKIVRAQDDERVQELLSRKQQLGFGHLLDTREEDPDEQRGQKRKAEEGPKEENKVSKSQRRKKAQKAKKAESKVQNHGQADQGHSKPKAEASININSGPPLSQGSAVRHALTQLNKNIRCTRNDVPELPISEIMQCKSNGTSSPDTPKSVGISRSAVRVVDFKPCSLEQFARPVPNEQQRPDVEPDSESETEQEQESDSDSDHSTTSLAGRRRGTSIPTPSHSSKDPNSKKRTKQKHEWYFVLLLEDAMPPSTSASNSTPTPTSGSTPASSPYPPSAVPASSSNTNPATQTPPKSERMIAYVSGADAEFLLDMKARDLRSNSRALAQLREKMFLLWGDLEERKVKEAEEKERGRGALRESSGNASGSGSSQAREERTKENGRGGEEKVMTRPFTCCIKEYGVRNDAKGVWERRFGVCETRIMDGGEEDEVKEAEGKLEVTRFRAPVAG
ncbi:hypothetical protein MMC10_009729 [Thelotrema lepadinum]|nr:hypothetical protein [Thelotrema lepadinum]